MTCKGCKSKKAVKMVSVIVNKKIIHGCDQCAKDSPVEIRRHIKSRDPMAMFEVPKAIRQANAEAARSRPKMKDTPIARDITRVDPERPRVTIYDEGSTSKSNRDARVMQKLINKLGPNPKILFNDGFKVVAESTVLR